MVKADLHNHLRTGSKLKQGDFDRAIDVAFRRLGRGGVFGMVNFDDDRYEHFVGLKGYDRDFVQENGAAIYVPKKKVYVVKGQEIPTRQGHLLALGIGSGQHLKGGRSLEETIKEIRDNGGIVVADHPFYLAGVGKYLKANPDLVGELDAIEVYNGEASFGVPLINFPLPANANRKAREFYDSIKRDFLNVGALTSSDGHSFFELGGSWTEINAIDEDDFVNNLKEAIQRTNLLSSSYCNGLFGKTGAVEHIAQLVWYKSLQKVGAKPDFETRDVK